MATGTYDIRHWVDGRPTGEPTRERHNPARPDELVARTAEGDATTVDAAVTAALRAQPQWAATPAPHRGQVLHDAANALAARTDRVARDLVREEGKTLTEATAEVGRAVDILRFQGGEGWRAVGEHLPSSTPRTFVLTTREPLGVVALITPWNFPIAIPTWKAAPALVAGNAVVLKPAELTPVCANHLAEVLDEAGLPAGVFNVVHGDGSQVGAPLVNHRGVAGISFTGSVETGRSVAAAAAAHGARVQLEMGGKNPLIVLDDADVALAARIAAVGGFGLTGQACTATSRVLTTPGVHAAVVEALVEEALAYAPGDGLAEGTRMGPLTSAAQADRVQGYLDSAREQGVRTATPPSQLAHLACPPTVLTGVELGHRVAREEIFGPVIGVIEVPDVDAAVTAANELPYGLAAGIVTRDLERAYDFASRVQAGVVKINRPTSGLDLNVPFGGVKGSSSNTYREQGTGALDFYSWIKTVYVGV
jgi:acyl-CoA reductase-like NAD-dependent aldehyde dehydrogenase